MKEITAIKTLLSKVDFAKNNDCCLFITFNVAKRVFQYATLCQCLLFSVGDREDYHNEALIN